MTKDYYKILGVGENASKEEIKSAYKKLAKKYHPDISKEADAEAQFKKVSEAAETLLDDNKKSQYDRFGSSGPQGGFNQGGGGFGGFGGGGFSNEGFGINVEEIFEQFGFGGFSSKKRARRQRKETRVFSSITIDLDDVYFGNEKEVTIIRDNKCETCNGVGTTNPKDIKTCSTCGGSGQVTEVQRSFLGSIRTQRICPDCKGTGKMNISPCNSCNGSGVKRQREKVSIKIPKGIEQDMNIRMTGKGHYDPDTKGYGDLYLKINIQIPQDVEIDGANIHKTININFVQAILGDEIEIEHFNKNLVINIPQGTQPETILRVKRKGLPVLNYESYGDLYLKVNIDIPKKISSKQKEILIEYSQTFNDKSFFDRVKGVFK